MPRLRRMWTVEEDTLLRRVVENTTAQGRPLLWRDLARSIPGRSNKDCRRRWWNSLAEGTAKGPWCEEEDTWLTNNHKGFETASCGAHPQHQLGHHCGVPCSPKNKVGSEESLFRFAIEARERKQGRRTYKEDDQEARC
ncbi:hypothetical protein F4825DRAFT_431083 [Nemania diffusa]|nr:hypothetical protein F4825DRAFT_431083 [Nemania diffusa]